MDYYLARKRRKVLTHAAIRIDAENTLSERSQIHKAAHCRIYENARGWGKGNMGLWS
jgi:hypothetical protein